MLKTEYDEVFIDQLAEKLAVRATEKIMERIKKQSEWPPMLGQEDIMNFFGCGRTLASQMMNRSDFPKLPDVGRKCVPLHLLYRWIDANTEWVQSNTDFFQAS